MGTAAGHATEGSSVQRDIRRQRPRSHRWPPEAFTRFMPLPPDSPQVPLGKRDLPGTPRRSLCRSRSASGTYRNSPQSLAGPARQAGPTRNSPQVSLQVPLGKRDLPGTPRRSRCDGRSDELCEQPRLILLSDAKVSIMTLFRLGRLSGPSMPIDRSAQSPTRLPGSKAGFRGRGAHRGRGEV